MLIRSWCLPAIGARFEQYLQVMLTLVAHHHTFTLAKPGLSNIDEKPGFQVKTAAANGLLACRDLKAENVLLHQQGHWVLCDFGSTTTFAGVYESTNAIMAAEEIIRKYTTPAYRAPEVRICKPRITP